MFSKEFIFVQAVKFQILNAQTQFNSQFLETVQIFKPQKIMGNIDN